MDENMECQKICHCLPTFSFFLSFFLLQANMKMKYFIKYAPFNVLIRKNTFSIKMVFLLSNSIDVINVFFFHLLMSSLLYIVHYTSHYIVCREC